LARAIIPETTENIDFRRNPDSIQENNPLWHQYGIITHSLHVLKAYHQELPSILRAESLQESIRQHFRGTIEGTEKAKLFEIAVVLHDLGKFMRTIDWQEGKAISNHNNHEAKSEEIIRTNGTVQQALKEQSLTKAQIDYISRCAGLHYKLADLREYAKGRSGFNFAFLESPECCKGFQDIFARFPDYAIEIGVFFIVDTLGKCELRTNASNEEELAQEKPRIVAETKSKGLPAELATATIQFPVNIKAGLNFLRYALEKLAQ